MLSRRSFSLGLTSAAFTGLAACSGGSSPGQGAPGIAGYGPLVPDAAGLLDLPRGFSYRVLSSFGDRMDDGYAVPDNADGMGCFRLDGRRVALVRNHELRIRHSDNGPFGSASGAAKSYDRNSSGQALPGGTTTIVYDLAAGTVDLQHLSLAGTIRNCGGGATPWSSWLSCEEDVTRAGGKVGMDHGWVFEVPARLRGLADPVPLKAMGRFNHEAAAVDPATGIVYLTEDRDDGLFYRFLPEARGRLAAGGRLQALGFVDAPRGGDSRNWTGAEFMPGAARAVRWIDLDGIESPDDDLRARGHILGAARFARGEGVHMGDGELYFCCTSGGAAQLGQIMRYRPSRFEGQAGERGAPGEIQLFVESTDAAMFNYGDNLTVAPSGHLIVCEDGSDDAVENHLRGVTPDGSIYTLGRIKVQTEPAGVCFSPDGSTLFMNLYSPAKTLAVTGPWA